jgi:hypothetical protein
MTSYLCDDAESGGVLLARKEADAVARGSVCPWCRHKLKRCLERVTCGDNNDGGRFSFLLPTNLVIVKRCKRVGCECDCQAFKRGVSPYV